MPAVGEPNVNDGERKVTTRWLDVAVVAGVINFVAFVVIALSIGGDAVAGKVESGRYFLSNHGRLTEVTRSVWLYSRAHAYSLWITHAVAIAALALRWRMRRRTHSRR